jgi:hypothetical protein
VTRLLLSSLSLGLCLATFIGSTSPSALAQPAGHVFAGLDGTWSGSGNVRFSDGKSEKISCRAYYNPKGAGTELGLAIRCASVSYKIEIRARLQNENGRLTGHWEERTFNASGEVTGKATAGKISMDIAGGGLTGSMSVSTNGSRQAVSISTEGSSLKGVTIALSRG